MVVDKASLVYLNWGIRLLVKKQELVQVLLLVAQLDKFIASKRFQLWDIHLVWNMELG